MIRSIHEVAEIEQFYTKSMPNNVIKINCLAPETYRTLIKHFKETNVYYHTYQLKEEKAFRVVIKHLNHTTDLEEIRHELLQYGHVSRNIINARNRTTKEPLSMFFVDLEPGANNKKSTTSQLY